MQTTQDMTTEYLGDGVYAECGDSNDGIQLYVDNGYGKEQIIFMDVEIIEKFSKYIDRLYDIDEDEPPEEHD